MGHGCNWFRGYSPCHKSHHGHLWPYYRTLKWLSRLPKPTEQMETHTNLCRSGTKPYVTICSGAQKQYAAGSVCQMRWLECASAMLWSRLSSSLLQ
jgi:hypothetical protein